MSTHIDRTGRPQNSTIIAAVAAACRRHQITELRSEEKRVRYTLANGDRPRRGVSSFLDFVRLDGIVTPRMLSIVLTVDTPVVVADVPAITPEQDAELWKAADARNGPPEDAIEAVLAEQDAEVLAETPKNYEARCMADIEAKPIEWLWEQRIALGKIALLGGQPKRGKSQLSCAFIAAVSTGGLWPDGTRAPQGSCILVTAEDDASDTIRPRLEAAGADLREVYMFDWAIGNDGKKQHFDVAAHISQITQMIRELGDVRLVVIDPVLAYMGRADSHKTGEVRMALMPLQTLAAELGFAVVLVTHLNKNEASTSAMNRMSASGAFGAVARSLWLVEYDPDDPTRERRIMAPVGANVGNDKEGFAFRVVPVDLGNGISTTKLKFENAPIRIEADDLIRPRDSAMRDAIEFLRNELAAGPQPIKQVKKAAHDTGVAPKTLDRARQKLGLRRKYDDTGGEWVWELPIKSADDNGLDDEFGFEEGF